MTYDFTSVMNRQGMDAIAVDAVGKTFAPGCPKEGFDVIPMWVADMNFPTCPTIPAAIMARVQEPHFGYFRPRDQWFEGIIRWQMERNGVKGLTRECIGSDAGVLGAVMAGVSLVAQPGDKVLLHTPAYIGFTGSLKNGGYNIVGSELVKDEAGIYRMDFEDMEQKIREQHIHVAVFCSPHNPAGRVWERWELEKAMALFEKYDVTVISDEIWADILLGGRKHIPLQSVSDWARNNTIACYAITKTFNLAGLQASYHIIYNPTLRDRFNAAVSKSHYNHMNVLSMYALMAAYTDEGMDWVNQLCATLTENISYAADFMRTNFQGISICEPEGTYMMFLDCEQWCKAKGKTLDELLRAGWEVGVMWQDGRPFGGPYTIRLNWALPRVRVEEALRRMKEYVF